MAVFCLQHLLAVAASLPTAVKPVESTLVAKLEPGISIPHAVGQSKLTPHKMYDDDLTFKNRMHCNRKMSINCQTSV